MKDQLKLLTKLKMFEKLLKDAGKKAEVAVKSWTGDNGNKFTHYSAGSIYFTVIMDQQNRLVDVFEPGE